MHTEVIEVIGMTSEDCTETVMRAIKTIDGIGTVAVTYPASQAIVEYNDVPGVAQQIAVVLAKAGYGVRKRERGDPGKQVCSGRCGACSRKKQKWH